MENHKNGFAEQSLVRDVFETIVDWRHYAILELMKTHGFKSDLLTVAKLMGMKPAVAQIYVERLIRTGLIQVQSDGTWKDCSEGFSSHILSETETTIAHRHHQKQIMQLALQSIDKIAFNQRDQSSMMMATSYSKIAEAKKRIKVFRRELCEFLEEGMLKETVFQLTLSLFPIIEVNKMKF